MASVKLIRRVVRRRKQQLSLEMALEKRCRRCDRCWRTGASCGGGPRSVSTPPRCRPQRSMLLASSPCNRCGVVLLRLRLHGAELRLRLRQSPFAGSFLPWAWRDGGRSGAGIGAVARDPRGRQQLSCVASQQATVSQDDYDEPPLAGMAVLAGAIPLASCMSQRGNRSDSSYDEIGRCRSGWTFTRWGTRLRPACCTVG
eukprot:COSAG01_NODE_1289_length_10885_cov_3.769331_13_plen_200_part_00